MKTQKEIQTCLQLLTELHLVCKDSLHHQELTMLWLKQSEKKNLTKGKMAIWL